MSINSMKEKWINDIYQSMKGYKPVSPKHELFLRIQDQFCDLVKNKVSLNQWRNIAVAASLILMFNLAALSFYKEYKQSMNRQDAFIENYKSILITSYKIY